MKRVLLPTIVLILVIAGVTMAVSCGSGTTTTATSPTTTQPTFTPSTTATVTVPANTETPMPVDNVEVIIENFEYIPPSVTISIGTTVTWRNNDSVQHTVTSRNDLFDSGLLGQGVTFSHLFIEQGEYDYYCIPHPYMTGKVIVQ